MRPFLEAAEEGDAGALSRLLRQGAEINAREEPNLSQRYSMGWTAGKTALIKAAQQARAGAPRRAARPRCRGARPRAPAGLAAGRARGGAARRARGTGASRAAGAPRASVPH